jgi:hypothetical protein
MEAVLTYLTPSLLALAFLTSTVTFVLRRSKQGSVALPLHTTTLDDTSALTEDKPDPFNLHDAQVFEDGTSLDDGLAFWRKVKLVKIPLLLALVVLMATKLLQILLPLVNGTLSARPSLELAEQGIAFVLYTYLVALAIAYVPMHTQPEHWGMTIHIASVVGTVVLVRSLETLLPSREQGKEDLARRLPFVELATSFVSSLLFLSSSLYPSDLWTRFYRSPQPLWYLSLEVPSSTSLWRSSTPR